MARLANEPVRAFSLAVLIVAASACGDSGPRPQQSTPSTVRPDAVDTAARSEAERTPNPVPARPRVVALGDSLTAGLGLSPEEAYPALLQQRIAAAGLDFDVVNAGVSGDTSAGGLRRLDWSLDGDVRVLILALGANDGLRGLPVAEMRKNLSAIIERAQRRGATVILAGMEAPPNFGRAYTAEFRQAYADLAAEHRLVFVPFLLQGVAGIASLNQRDGIHPTAEGARIIADTIWEVLRPVLEKLPVREGS